MSTDVIAVVGLVLAGGLLGAGAAYWFKTGRFPPILSIGSAVLAVASLAALAIRRGDRPEPVAPVLPTPLPVPPENVLPVPKQPTDYLGPVIGLDEVAKDVGVDAAGASDAVVGATGAGFFDPGAKP